jgi:hypothetical protein
MAVFCLPFCLVPIGDFYLFTSLHCFEIEPPCRTMHTPWFFIFLIFFFCPVCSLR